MSPTSSPLSTPRIPSELKGKGIDPAERVNTKVEEPNDDWLNGWSSFDEELAYANRPNSQDSDESLARMWDDNNR
jgi:hypothetical protein